MLVPIESSWSHALRSEFEKPYWESLIAFVETEYQTEICFPPAKDIFRAFELTPLHQVRVVIIGQDPYHTPGAAMGLAFSIATGNTPQPSLKNIFKELASDLGIARKETDLSDWAEQGVLLLNSVLTVQNGAPASHRKQGWETFTDRVISIISQERKGVVFVLWGNYAISKRPLIDETRHKVITSAHPSPLSAYQGFFGSKPFHQINQYLSETGQASIHWG